MKKTVVLICILMVSISFGQTKKKKNTKKELSETVVKEKKNVLEVEKSEEVKIIDRHVKSESAMVGDIGNSENENSIYKVEQIKIKPEFKGGEAAMKKFFLANLKIQQPIESPKIMGKVLVSFVVEKTGNITDLKLINNLGNGIGEEVIRVCKLMPRWLPGHHNSTTVRTLYMLPVEINGK